MIVSVMWYVCHVDIANALCGFALSILVVVCKYDYDHEWFCRVYAHMKNMSWLGTVSKIRAHVLDLNWNIDGAIMHCLDLRMVQDLGVCVARF